MTVASATRTNATTQSNVSSTTNTNSATATNTASATAVNSSTNSNTSTVVFSYTDTDTSDGQYNEITVLTEYEVDFIEQTVIDDTPVTAELEEQVLVLELETEEERTFTIEVDSTVDVIEQVVTTATRTVE